MQCEHLWLTGIYYIVGNFYILFASLHKAQQHYSFSCPLPPGSPPSLLVTSAHIPDPEFYHFHHLDLPPGHPFIHHLRGHLPMPMMEIPTVPPCQKPILFKASAWPAAPVGVQLEADMGYDILTA
ncbi:hypothetical protein DSO57_1014807 [Entomophthora muscae]|uniref:Uncharacterized protein n=1 Tax=Entomophthora muscae TaxID=34485 RepID=A0ACC2UR08_9FUNG|nr:hypothetical protein DSO57_1014807 [Entomophthora muscae]